MLSSPTAEGAFPAPVGYAAQQVQSVAAQFGLTNAAVPGGSGFQSQPQRADAPNLMAASV